MAITTPIAGTITVTAPTAPYAALCVSQAIDWIVGTTYPLCGSESSAPDEIATTLLDSLKSF